MWLFDLRTLKTFRSHIVFFKNVTEHGNTWLQASHSEVIVRIELFPAYRDILKLHLEIEIIFMGLFNGLFKNFDIFEVTRNKE